MFIYFKKAFDREWHEALWATTKSSTLAGRPLIAYIVYTKTCSIGTGNYWRMVSHISWSSTDVSALPNPLQHVSGGYHDLHPR